MKTDKVVKEFFEKEALTQKGFADALNERLVEIGVSRVSVSNWLRGRNEPETDFLEAMLVAYDSADWRFAFALACLVVKSPLVWGQGGVVWAFRTLSVAQSDES